MVEMNGVEYVTKTQYEALVQSSIDPGKRMDQVYATLTMVAQERDELKRQLDAMPADMLG